MEFVQLSQAFFPQLMLVEKSLGANGWSPERLLDAWQAHALNLGMQEQDNLGLMGFILTRRLVDELHILRLAVAKNVQGKGVATDLLRGLIFWASLQNIGTMWLEVRESNEAAQHIYHKMGFHIIYTRPDYYPSLRDRSSRENALVMSRSVL